MSVASELERIATLAAIFHGAGSLSRSGVSVGIGDDAAVLDPAALGAGVSLVWTIDEQVEGTHFRREWLTWRLVGYRSFMAAASDLAAMGAEPWCALASLVLPLDLDDAAFEDLARGQREASDAVGAPIVGGNLARGDAVSVTTTLLGRSARPLLRTGARAGDGLWLAGEVGLAAAGLAALLRGGEGARLADAVDAWRSPRARVADGRAMVAYAHAAIDISDGLAQDISHLARASDLCAVIDEVRLRAACPRAHSAAEALGGDALELILHGGEDYALVAASDAPIPGFSCIGELRAGAGLVLARATGEESLAPRGFDHFAPKSKGSLL